MGKPYKNVRDARGLVNPAPTVRGPLPEIVTSTFDGPKDSKGIPTSRVVKATPENSFVPFPERPATEEALAAMHGREERKYWPDVDRTKPFKNAK